MRSYVVSPEGATLSAEDFLLEICKLGPRAAIKRAFLSGAVRVGGRIVDRSRTLRAGESLTLDADDVFARDEFNIFAAENEPLEVVASAPDMIVVNKPSGQNTHPLKPTETDTALNAIVARYPTAATPATAERPLEGSLVHRLDGGTSGLLVCALKPETWSTLRTAWNERSVAKVYLAWLEGELRQAGTIECFLAHDPKSKKRMSVHATEPRGLKAWSTRTSFSPVQVSLCDGKRVTASLIRIHTGVTHQIRAVSAALGHAVFGDPVYSTAKTARLTMSPLETETSALFRACAAELAKRPLSSPRLELLPAHGFFLHAFYLRSPAHAVLAPGLFAAPPSHFG